jgi:Holliday junction DNA helicase RuvA
VRLEYAGLVIGWLSGTVLERDGTSLLLEVNGVGYEVAISSALLGNQGGAGDELALWVHAHATSDHPLATLYGFLSPEQRRVFRLLLRVKGIGPRLAQAVVGQLGDQGLARAVRNQDLARLTSVPGVGKKTAQQIILDLAEQVGNLSQPVALPSGQTADVTSALINLGFRRPEVERAVRLLRDRRQLDGGFDDVLRRALALLREG